MSQLSSTSSWRDIHGDKDDSDDIVQSISTAVNTYDEDRAPLLRRSINGGSSYANTPGGRVPMTQMTIVNHEEIHHLISAHDQSINAVGVNDTRNTNRPEAATIQDTRGDDFPEFNWLRIKDVTLLCIKAWFAVIMRLWTASFFVCVLYMVARRLPPGRRVFTSHGQSFSSNLMVQIDPIVNVTKSDSIQQGNEKGNRFLSTSIFKNPFSHIFHNPSSKLAIPASFGSILETPFISPIYILENVTNGCRPFHVSLPILSEKQIAIIEEKSRDLETKRQMQRFGTGSSEKFHNTGLTGSSGRSGIRVVKSKRDSESQEEHEDQSQDSLEKRGSDSKSSPIIAKSSYRSSDSASGTNGNEKAQTRDATSNTKTSSHGSNDPDEMSSSTTIQKAKQHLSKEANRHGSVPFFYRLNASSYTAVSHNDDDDDHPQKSPSSPSDKPIHRAKNTSSSEKSSPGKGTVSSKTTMVHEKRLPWFALIRRGGCSFDEKVLNVERAGFRGVIVYNDRRISENGLDLPVRMSSYLLGGLVHAYAMFLTQEAGQSLIQTAKGIPKGEVLLTSFEPKEWYLLPGHVSVGGAMMDMIYLLYVVSLFGTLFLVTCLVLTLIRNGLIFGQLHVMETLFEGCHLILMPPPPPSAPIPSKLSEIPFPIRTITESDVKRFQRQRQETCGAACLSLGGKPEVHDVEKPNQDDIGNEAPLITSFHDFCAICLDEFEAGSQVRDLPCRHTFHSCCLDPWLLGHNRLCPTCKRDVLEPIT